MKQFLRTYEPQIVAASFLVALLGYGIWMILSVSAHLSAPTTAIVTAAIYTLGRRSSLQQIYRVAFASGTVTTGFLWLFSNTQPIPNALPTEAIEAWAIIVGWGITAFTILIAAAIELLPRNYFTVIPKHPKRKRIIDYVVGILGTSLFCFLTALILSRVGHVLTSPAELQENIIGIIWMGPFFGWLLTWMFRSQNSSVWTPPKDPRLQKR